MSYLSAVFEYLLNGRSLVCILAMVVTAPYSGAHAYLVLKPELSTRNSYDDNPRLRLQNTNALVFTSNELVVDSTFVSPTYQIGITPTFRLSRFTEETELNSEEYLVSTFATKLFQRHQLGATFDFAREASFVTEVDDSGIFDINLFRTTLSGQINWSYYLSERVTLSFNGYATDVSFEEDPRSFFVDYFLYGAGASVRYDYSETTSFWVIFNRADFKTPALSSETGSYIFQVGFDHELTETVDVSFRIGRNRSNLEFKQARLAFLSLNPPVLGTVLGDEEENASGDVIQATVEKKFARASLTMQWDRRFSPSSQGVRQEIEEVSGYLRYRVARHVSLVGRVNFRNQLQEGTLITTRVPELEILQYEAKLFYRVSPSLRAELGYRYRDQTSTRQAEGAESHRVFVGLRFSPAEMRFW